MAAPKDLIRVCQHQHTLTFLVDGWGTMSQCYNIRKLIEQCFEHGIHTIRFDLRNCCYMDSTFLGTLLATKRNIERRGEGTFILVSPSPEALQLLRKMCMDTLFTIMEENETADSIPGMVPRVLCDADTLRNNILDVHRELAQLPGAAGEPFRAMVQGFERELEETKRVN